MERAVRILILEDRASDNDLMEFELQEGGISFESRWARNEREYVEALRDFSPDVILSDYDLPQYSGALALLEAKKLYPHVPFVVVTGAFDSEGSQKGELLALGADDCIFKSRLEGLAPTVQRLLSHINKN